VCNDWIKVHRDMSRRHAKALKLEAVEESHLTTAQSTPASPISVLYRTDFIVNFKTYPRAYLDAG